MRPTAATKVLAALVQEGVLRKQTVGNAKRYARASWGAEGAAPALPFRRPHTPGVQARCRPRGTAASAHARPADETAQVAGLSVPLRAHPALLDDDSAPPALVARCNTPLLMHLAAVGAPLDLRCQLPCTHTGDCSCAANPVSILGRRREVYASGARSTRLWAWLMARANPADGGRPFSAAWDELTALLESKARDAAVRMGLPPSLAQQLAFSSRCLIECPTVRRKGDAGGVPAPAALPGCKRQTGHADWRGLQVVVNTGVGPCEATSVYTGPYASEACGDAAANRPLAEEAVHAAERARGAIDELMRPTAATLFRPRADLEAALQPAAPRLLQPGEGVALWGPAVHAGAGSAPGEWRCVFFFTAHLPGEHGYDADTQVLPWSAALDLYGSAALAKQTALAYGDCEPWQNFSGAVAQEVEQLVRSSSSALRAWTEAGAPSRGKGRRG